MEAEQVLAFRLARSGLAARGARGLAEAAACPASDFTRDAALLALAARADGVTREAYDRAVDAGEVVVAHVVRGAIHALAGADHALFGPALLASDDEELRVQLGQQVRRLCAEHGIAPSAALAETAEATADALAGGAALDKVALHEALRSRVRPELMPWCNGCGSHHVAPMLWRYATVRVGARFDTSRRYALGEPARVPAAHEAVRRFLRWYGPSTPRELAGWAGLAPSHARRLWDEVAGDLEEVPLGSGPGWVLREDVGALDAPPAAEGVRLLPAGDPYLQAPNRPLLTPDPALRKRLFRPVASPGAVLRDGRLVALWKTKAKGKAVEVTVEPLGRLPRGLIDEEAARLAALRGADRATVVVA